MVVLETSVSNITLSVEILDGFQINSSEINPSILYGSLVAAILILVVSILVIHDIISKSLVTFIDVMILLDCCLSLGHLPIFGLLIW